MKKDNTPRIQHRAMMREKILCGKAYRKALCRNELKKLPCFICGDLVVDGHHPDYSTPLSVVWLCRNHHNQLHKEFSLGKSKPYKLIFNGRKP